MKRTLPLIVAILCGVLSLADFIIPNPQLDALGAVLVEGVTILAAFALLLGLLNILGTHVHRVATGEGSRGLSLSLILAMLITMAVGIAFPHSGALRWIFRYLYVPLQSTMTALLAFFVVSAAYRAFRLRNIEALILLVTSLLVLFTQLPFVGAISPSLAIIRDWLMRVPVTAATRGLILGIALGTIATSLRILLAVDRPYTGE